ncbi:Dabb family protein [Aureimonas leprariae]|uniref:Dabb family protein n=1 Tax=Plantimonas leprariae TaxID=2615207 RepID=A0A7V7PQZ4_9HYPH|nr:Dabb family protein [Aureimonas leprariae]KAB0680871.1 Dabb family protein [Aureimonas leprariae]
MAAQTRLLRHVVLFGFKGSSTDADVAECVRRFALLPQLVPGVAAFEWGRNVSPEGKANGHTHCFQMAFANEADRDAYLTHPDHVAFGDHIRPHVEHVTVVDYWVAAGD